MVEHRDWSLITVTFKETFIVYMNRTKYTLYELFFGYIINVVNDRNYNTGI